MIKNKDIICISSIDWDFVWQGHQEIMSAFAKNGNRVLFIENTGIRVPTFSDLPRIKKRIINWLKGTRGFREVSSNLFVYSPLALPLPYSRLAQWANKYLLVNAVLKWVKIMGFYEPIVWTFLPTQIALNLADAIERKLLVYYCIADFYELAHNPKKVKKIEDRLIRESNLVFAQGQALYSRCRALNENVHIFPFGVNLEIFENYSLKDQSCPSDLAGINKPLIGYIGGLHRHIDFELIESMARQHAQWSFVMVGPVQTNIPKLRELNNVHLIGKKEISELPAYLSRFDVAIIPYKNSAYTSTVYPTKLNEYLAMGKPVVSTALPEVINFNNMVGGILYIAKDREEFQNHILRALRETDPGLKERRIALASKNNWPNRIEEMSHIMEAAISKRDALPSDWKRSLSMFYRQRKRKLLRWVLIFGLIYFILFYSPLIWILAGPLKIAEAPRQADAIVVFAGGVGESGMAGQGYEERIKYACELYKKGFAGTLIVSSGYSYVFKEPVLMKTLALSLGIPDSAVILEEKAKNTYENVVFSSDILKSNKMKRILLVSSPYHMLRAGLTFKKNEKQIEVIYTPIPESKFYYHEQRRFLNSMPLGRVKLVQIKGIIHEYLGIVYYWLRGWI